MRKVLDWVVILAALAATSIWYWVTDGGEHMHEHGLGLAVVFLIAMAMILAACMSLTRPWMVTSEAALVVLGLLMVATPFWFSLAGVPEAAWPAWIIGGLVAVLGLAGLALSRGERARPLARNL